MRFLHTADWHIGKIVHEQSMLADQAYILEQLIEQVEEYKVDAVLMAGDLYDRSLPPKEAVSLVNQTLSRLINELEVPVFIIAGNHDSNERIEYLSGVAEAKQLYMEGILKAHTRKVSLKEADIYMMPYADHVLIRQALDQPEIRTIEEAVAAQVEQITSSDEFDRSRINMVMFHGYVISGSRTSLEESDSERPLSIGTAEWIDQSIFDAFDYVALGHLHKGQKVGSNRIRYSGSPLKYSKSEATHQKKSFIIDIDRDSLEVTPVPLIPKRDMRIVRGAFDDLMQQDWSDDYIFIELTDDMFIQDAMSRLRGQFPQILGLEYVNLRADQSTYQTARSQDLKSQSIESLFSDFFEQYTEHTLDEPRREVVREIVRLVEQEETV
ncbi:exonuclease SbcCD subunit D [Dolosigranulum pigrum]|uniref:exonuclease SbcCD subunit D n=1 Tax=Dolosigranulum pigrum TaxID=29394 RepID=UPI000DC3BEA4|nr:exonuclease SbcCD subunit D [Dolosigranulum pigrum]QTJ37305.1 exonuclease SbcCD subunit D [Dolosigranulum pigrum]QTJ55538.1 exonuclease SbcCD subunit D [Dolosigranulum pigrum]RAN52960.1 exonuclease sbcCD subunit D [Dolosigranulum pigrum]